MKINIVNKSKNPAPKHETIGSAGMDIRANLANVLTIAPLERVLVPTGLFMELSQGYEAQLRPRSGLAYKQGISIPNSPATIDSDYRGEIKVLLINLSDENVVINHGDRIAQMVIAKHETVVFNEVETLEETKRGNGGFGSTGIE